MLVMEEHDEDIGRVLSIPDVKLDEMHNWDPVIVQGGVDERKDIEEGT